MEAALTEPRFLPQGDAALVVEFGDRIDRVTERVREFGPVTPSPEGRL